MSVGIGGGGNFWTFRGSLRSEKVTFILGKVPETGEKEQEAVWKMEGWGRRGTKSATTSTRR